MRLVFDNPFEAEGSWFKGNVHTHTTNSDGHMTPEQIVLRYREAGYDFLSITDHGVLMDTRELSRPDLLMIPGEEICAGARASAVASWDSQWMTPTASLSLSSPSIYARPGLA